MLNELLINIEKSLPDYIKPISELKLKSGKEYVFDIESCAKDNNTRALTYSIAVMPVEDNEKNICYWTNNVQEFILHFVNYKKVKHITLTAHNCLFDIKPMFIYLYENYDLHQTMPDIKLEKYYDYSERKTLTLNVENTTKRKLKNGDYTMLIKNGVFYNSKLKLNDKIIEFKDSYKYAPYSLQKCAEDFLGLKLSKGGLDYEKERSLDDELTIEELKYIYEDVFSLKHLVKLLVYDGIKVGDKIYKQTTLTSSSDALRYYKLTLLDDFLNHKNMFKDEKLWEEINNILMVNKFYECKNENTKALKVFRALFPELSIGLDQHLRRSYYGGLSMVDFKNVEKFSKLDNHNGVVLDVNSLYPFTMLEYLLPYGKCIVKQEPYETLPKSFKKDYPLYIQEITIHNLKVKKNKVKFIQVKGDEHFNGRDILESNIDEEGKRRDIQLLLPSPLYELLFECYDVKSYELGRCYCFKGHYGLFTNYMTTWKELKQNSSGAIRAFAKLKQNGLYGKFGTNPKSELTTFYSIDGIFSADHQNVEYYSSKSVYLPMASFITSYAKAYLVRAINNNRQRFLYCDTDSLHLYGTLDEVKGVKIGKKIYGYWDNELCFDDFKYLGSKRYAEHNKETGQWEIKCCGLTDKILKKIDDIEVFDYCEHTTQEVKKLLKDKIIIPGKDKEDIYYYYPDGSKVKGLIKSQKSKIVKNGTIIVEQPYLINKYNGYIFR